VPLTVMLDVIAGLSRGIGALADELAGQVVEQIAPPLVATGDADQLQSLLQRWRVLLLQGVASILADRLGAALLAKAEGEGEPTGEQLRAAIDRIRVGATTDTAGTIRRHRT
jgi:hypothetical protein